MFNILS